MDKYEEYMEYEADEPCVKDEFEICWFCGECGKY